MRLEELKNEIEAAKKLKKEYDFSQRITKRYMPYSEKCSLVKNVVESSSYDEINGKKYYKRDTASMMFLFTMKLITEYTDLEFEVKDVVTVYDELMASGLMKSLLDQIPAEEIAVLKGMLDMRRDDEEVNFHSLVSFFETKADALQIALDSFSKVLEKPEIQAKIAELTK